MTKWLASVQSVEEARILLPCLPDILDIKDPSKGALGALDVEIVAEIVSLIDKRCLTSATIGDLPMDVKVMTDAMVAMARTGIDYVKIGIFPDKNVVNCIKELNPVVKKLEKPAIAVLFADKNPKLGLIQHLRESGFHGAMVDTAIKNGQRLPDHWSESELQAFINTVHQHDMLCGLAGALTIEDIAELKLLGADYLGFRSALCERRKRTQELQLSLAKQVQQEMVI